jgi:hypothetical protein
LYVTTNIFKSKCDKVSQGNTPSSIIPYLLFDYKITTHQFYYSVYFKPLSDKQTKLRNEVMRLHNKGWSNIRIHEYLLKNGYEIGKSVNTVSQLMRRIKKREEISSQPIIDGIGNFRIKMLEII